MSSNEHSSEELVLSLRDKEEMNITIPIYIELLPQEDKSLLYAVRPLFFSEPVARAEELQRAIARFAKELRKTLNAEGKLLRHDSLAAYAFAPEVEEQLLKLSLDLKTRTAQVNFLFVTLEKFDRRLVFTPSLPQLWFELARGEDLPARAADVLTRYFRGKEKLPNDHLPKPEDVAAPGKAWASTVEIEIFPPRLGQTPKEEFRALLGGSETLDGETELHQTGRCLDWLYPDELNRVVAREREVEELTRLLSADDRRPVLLTGPRLVGKTALIEEFVFRRHAAGKPQYSNKNEVWLLAPQRLISGMSYVGQWENRLLAILKEAQKRDHILYCDDLLGLFKAGISRDSNLNVAQVMKPYLERRDVRLLGEITPEAWRVLREQDRGFADLFQLLPIKEPSEDETLAMMLGLQRQLEQQHRCQFDFEVLPAVLDLQRRYVRDAAFPGKAAQFLRQLAIKRRYGTVSSWEVFGEFQNKTGLQFSFVTNNAELSRSQVIGALRMRVKGQDAALAALADAVTVARARLNDPDRPFASFLFLGPTGVGKTQCAKSLAAYLFSSDERLLRFDMNEFVAPDAVARLVGTFDQPEGLLTSAVRRQPFSVVLFDEIEKAHPDVFNLLLQVMGDGRLTDALGRTADFTNTILILTSNLGVKEAGSELGFAGERAGEASIYTQAAERFFSPEFFNRLDRIVPFARLDRQTISEIAQVLLWEVFNREGLQRRRAALVVHNDALARLVDAGYHPQLGARALKRAIEKQVTHSLAAHLAAQPRTAPMLIEVLPARQHLHLHLQEFAEAAPHATNIEPLLAAPEETLARITAFLQRLDDEITTLQPTGAISLDALQPEHYRYFALREQINRLRGIVERLSNQFAAAARHATRLTRSHPRPARRPPKGQINFDRANRHLWRELFAAEDIQTFLQELAAAPRSEDHAAKEQIADAVREAALLSLLAHSQEQDFQSGALVLFNQLARAGYDDGIGVACSSYVSMFQEQFGWQVELLREDARADGSEQQRDWLAVRGTLAAELLAHEAGTHLNFADDSLLPFQVKVFPLAPAADARTAVNKKIEQYETWRTELTTRATFEAALLQANPFRLDPVTRIYRYTQGRFSSLVDVRSGVVAQSFASNRTLRALLLTGLPLPPELID